MSHDFNRQIALPPPAPVRATSGYISGGLIAIIWLMMIHVAAAQTHKLRVQDPAVARALVAQGGKLVADYDSFQVIETDQTSLPGMSDESVQVVDHFDSIELNGRHLGTRAREVQSLRTSLHIPSGKGLHLVHFAGPVKRSKAHARRGHEKAIGVFPCWRDLLPRNYWNGWNRWNRLLRSCVQNDGGP
jgi:hypothetical protein